MANYSPENFNFLKSSVARSLLWVNVVLALIYMVAIAFLFPVSNRAMFYILVAVELFHTWQALGFWYTIADMEYMPPRLANFTPAVDVFITVAGEPVEIVEETIRAAKAMDYPDFKVHVLNDGYVAKKDNWQEIEELCRRLNVNCITRTVPGGAKAGNINNGLRHTAAPFVAVFDADHVPHQNFLRELLSYMYDDKVGFVQSPQFYKNYEENYITAGAWEQQELFFAPILKGKNRMNSVFMCGTNMVIRRQALLEAGGMCEDNIAEDFLTSLFIHAKGWKSVYVPEILAEGLAPEDFLSYVKQQYRWARGSLEVIFWHNPLFMRGLTFKQKFQYLQSASYYLSGVAVLINALFPILFFFTGWMPFTVSTMVLAAVFLPYIFLTIYTLSASTNLSYTYRAVAFSMSLFIVHIRAMLAVIFRVKSGFSITSKRAVSGNFLNMVIPHIAYIVLMIGGAAYALYRLGPVSSVITNISWALLNAIIFSVFIVAALPEKKSAPDRRPEAVSEKAVS